MHYNCFVLQLRHFQTSATQRDIDQAAKYIGAGAATVGVAGSGEKQELVRYFHNKLSSKSISDVVEARYCHTVLKHSGTVVPW